MSPKDVVEAAALGRVEGEHKRYAENLISKGHMFDSLNYLVGLREELPSAPEGLGDFVQLQAINTDRRIESYTMALTANSEGVITYDHTDAAQQLKEGLETRDICALLFKHTTRLDAVNERVHVEVFCCDGRWQQTSVIEAEGIIFEDLEPQGERYSVYGATLMAAYYGVITPTFPRAKVLKS